MSETPAPHHHKPVSYEAAAAALAAIDAAVRAAQSPPSGPPGREGAGTGHDPGQGPGHGPQDALAALLLLREVRSRLAGWEAPLVDAARAAGATWADLAHPMGVASRQAAENRYLRLAPVHGPGDRAGTGAERVKAVRDRRAAERTVTAWARDHAADLRIIASQIAALGGLAPEARRAQSEVHAALGATDAASLLGPLAAMRPHLPADQPDLAARLDTLTRQTDRLRHDTRRRRA
ncbi:hypothetical protein [Streptacidiphilus monticola]|uniref:Type III effector protein n=1 Tax=Streptacidiphilus monticola TaxID=2161674 RepID=A0ABW1G8U3_9ACTN